MIGYTFYKGVKNHAELRKFVETEGDMPECESFQETREGDNELIEGKGYIEEEYFDEELFKQIPKTLKEALRD